MLDARPPSLAEALLRESLLPFDVLRLALGIPALVQQPGGAGESVMVLPGFGASDASTVPLRTYLRLLGYRVTGWGFGVNRGDLRTLVPRVADAVERLAAARGETIRLVGWSLGGTLAREAARERPDAVARIVTLGTPVVGGPKYTRVAEHYRRRGFDLDALEAAVEARNAVPIRAPITAIYSRGDGVVAWEACIDRASPDVEHVEVRSTHVGLGVHPDVYRIVADRLARRPRLAVAPPS